MSNIISSSQTLGSMQDYHPLFLGALSEVVGFVKGQVVSTESSQDMNFLLLTPQPIF